MTRLPRPEAPQVEPARLGGELREARLALGLSIEDMSEALRIRRVYLMALEEGRIRDLPAPAYAIGFVRSYARSLGLDEAEVVRRFRAASGTVAGRRDLVFPEPVPDRGVPAGAVVLVGAVLAVGAYVGWYQWSGTGLRTVDSVPPLPSAIEQVLRDDPMPDPARGVTLGPQNPSATPSGNPAAANAAPVPPGQPARPVASPPAEPPVAAVAPPAGRILLRAKGDVWVQVRDRQGGAPLVKRVLKAGESFPVPPQDGLVLSTGNHQNLEILVDGQPAAGFVPGAPARSNVALVADTLKAERIAAPPPPKAKPPATGADAAYVPPATAPSATPRQ